MFYLSGTLVHLHFYGFRGCKISIICVHSSTNYKLAVSTNLFWNQKCEMGKLFEKKFNNICKQKLFFNDVIKSVFSRSLSNDIINLFEIHVVKLYKYDLLKNV